MVWLISCGVVLSLCLLYTSGRYLGLSENNVCKQEGGKEWICKKLTNCPKVSEIIEAGKASQLNICGYIEYEPYEPVVCCEPEVEVNSKEVIQSQRNVCKREAGKERICKKLTNCPKASEMIIAGKASQLNICGYSRYEPIVCCEPEVEVKSISQRKCEEYAHTVYVEIEMGNHVIKESVCAVTAEPLIFRGKNTVPREFPHMALIGYNGMNNRIMYLCGGSLISERYIVSAAHCTDGIFGLAKWARLGDYDIKSTEDENFKHSSPVVYEIEQHINHPRYKPPELYNDIALYRLSKNVIFNEYIRPCCLNYNPEESYKQAIATGWGLNGTSGIQISILQKVTLNIYNSSQCNSKYQQRKTPNKQYPNGILQSMLCAADLINGGNTCQGDSGGPLQILLDKPYCMYSVLGVTSTGGICESNDIPTIYTNVTQYIPWIESIVWPS